MRIRCRNSSSRRNSHEFRYDSVTQFSKSVMTRICRANLLTKRAYLLGGSLFVILVGWNCASVAATELSTGECKVKAAESSRKMGAGQDRKFSNDDEELLAHGNGIVSKRQRVFARRHRIVLQRYRIATSPELNHWLVLAAPAAASTSDAGCARHATSLNLMHVRLQI